MSFNDPGFEDQVAQSMRDTGEELSPRDLTRLVNGGVADGRRRRRRRNAAVVGGSAALALVAVGGAMVPSLLNTSGTQNVAGPAAQPKMKITASAKPVSDAERAQQLLRTLESVLPAGKVSQTRANWLSKVPAGINQEGYAQLVLDDGHGASLISVDVTRYRVTDGQQQPGCPPNPALEPNTVCHTYQLPGGGRLVVNQGYEYPSKGTGTKEWDAWLTLPDGAQLSISEWNSSGEKDTPTSRATPPLSADQLRSIALSDVWKPILKAIPAPQGQRAGASGKYVKVTGKNPAQAATPGH